MQKLTGRDIPLVIGVSGLLLTGLFTITVGPHSPRRIEAQVQSAATAALNTAGVAYLTAEADGQKVDLRGVAPSEDIRAGAIEAVLTSLGQGGPFSGGVTKVTRHDLLVALPVAPYAWKAERVGRRVVLSGVVPTPEAMNVIHSAASTLFPAGVDNRMTLGFGAPEGVAWDIAAIQGLDALRRLNEGSAELIGDQLTLMGVAADDSTAQEVSDRLVRVGGGVAAQARVTGPAEWFAVISTEEGLVLSGRASSEETRAALAAAAEAAGASNIASRMTIGEAGDWQARALIALPHLTRFEAGSLRVQGRDFFISGAAAPSVLTYLREDMARLPDDGYTVVWSIKEADIPVPEADGLDLANATGEDKRQSCQAAFANVMASGKLVFREGAAALSRENAETLDKLVMIARACDGATIDVAGHTDSTGRRNSNITLSRLRAEAVRDWLTEHGFDASRITARGFGPNQPIATNRTEIGRAANRRIEIRVTRVETP